MKAVFKKAAAVLKELMLVSRPSYFRFFSQNLLTGCQ